MRALRVVGLDTSLTATGIVRCDGASAVVGESGLLAQGVSARARTLAILADRIVEWCRYPDGEMADLVVCELPHIRDAHGGQSERCGLFWMVAHQLGALGVQVAAVPATSAWHWAGSGVRSKPKVVGLVNRMWPHLRVGGNDNLADAAICMQMGRAWLGYDVGLDERADRLAVVKWPPRMVTQREAMGT